MAEKSNMPYDNITITKDTVSTDSMFSKCCFCVPLRLGCLILGYLNLCINVIQTLTLLALTTFIGLFTHGFDHFDKETRSQAGLPEVTPTDASEDPLTEPVLNQIGLLLILILIANAAWLIINIACLVGIHKKRPGPIRVYVGFASARFVIAVAAFIYLVMNNRLESHNILSHSIGLGLTVYFIFVYYIYAVKLEKDREAELTLPSSQNNVFIYPTKLEKGHLVA